MRKMFDPPSNSVILFQFSSLAPSFFPFPKKWQTENEPIFELILVFIFAEKSIHKIYYLDGHNNIKKYIKWYSLDL